MGYEAVEHDLWDHPRFRALPAGAKLLYLWAWTNHRGGVSGVFKCPVETVRAETRLSAGQIARALPDLHETMLRHYQASGDWWVMPKARRARSPQQRQGVRNQIGDCRDEAFRSEWSAVYSDLVPEAWRYPMHRVSIPSDRVSGPPDRVSLPNMTKHDSSLKSNANAVGEKAKPRSQGEESLRGRDGDEVLTTGLSDELAEAFGRMVGARRARDNGAGYRTLDAWAGLDGERQGIVREALSQTREDTRAKTRDGKPVIRGEPGAYMWGIIRRECRKRGIPAP